MDILGYIVVLFIGYIVGSIPFALIVGKVFYNKDIRKEGSGNLGGTNAGRVLSKQAGIAVMLLDILKSWVSILIATKVANHFGFDVNPTFAGLAAVVGHCYPIFAGFKGGKGVACAAGFILAVNPKLLLIAFVFLVIMLLWKKMMSLAVIVTLIAITIISFIYQPFANLRQVLVLLTVFITYKHLDNIQRIIHGNENTLSWLTKK